MTPPASLEMTVTVRVRWVARAACWVLVRLGRAGLIDLAEALVWGEFILTRLTWVMIGGTTKRLGDW